MAAYMLINPKCRPTVQMEKVILDKLIEDCAHEDAPLTQSYPELNLEDVQEDLT